MLGRVEKAGVFVCVVLAHAMLGWLSVRWQYVPSSADQEWHGTLFFVAERQRRKSDEPRRKVAADTASNGIVAEEPEIESAVPTLEQSVSITETDWRTSADAAVDSMVARQLQEESRRSLFSKPKPSDPKDSSTEERSKRKPFSAPGVVIHLGGGDYITGISTGRAHKECYISSILTAEGRRDSTICRSTVPSIDLEKMIDNVKPEYLKRELPTPKSPTTQQPESKDDDSD